MARRVVITDNNSHQSSFITHHPSLINLRQSVITHQSSPISHQSSLITHPSSTFASQSSLITHQSSVITHPSSTFASQSSLISHHPSVITHQSSPIHHHPSLTKSLRLFQRICVQMKLEGKPNVTEFFQAVERFGRHVGGQFQGAATGWHQHALTGGAWWVVSGGWWVVGGGWWVVGGGWWVICDV